MSNNYTFNSSGKLVDKNGKQLDTNSFPDNIVDPVSGNVLFSAKNGLAECGTYCTARPTYEYILYMLMIIAILFGIYYLYNSYTNSDGYLEKKIIKLTNIIPAKPTFNITDQCDKACVAQQKIDYKKELKTILKEAIANDLLGKRAIASSPAAKVSNFGADLKKLTKF